MNKQSMAQYNVVWQTPSEDHNGSMPIGNGDIGLNVWVEKKSGDLLFYISKTDLWSENGRLLKLGRVRVQITPNPLVATELFNQTLELNNGEITIKLGQGEKAINLRIWVDANRPVIRIEAASDSLFELTASVEIWRTCRRELVGDELKSAYGMMGADFPVYVEPDSVVDGLHNKVIWYHRNERSIWPDNLKLQALTDFIENHQDPLLYRTFGACIKGSDMVSASPYYLKSIQPQTAATISIYPLCRQTATFEEWSEQLHELVVYDENLETARAAHRDWWQQFWQRSWIQLSGNAEAEKISQAYVLQRWISACGGRGEFPIKFNGSIFTVDGDLDGYDADYRRWGGCYWWQNTRLPYWPMLASGDFDLMQPLFKMYCQALPLAKERTNIYYAHDGAFFPETIHFWGSYNNNNYGWERSAMADGYTKNDFIRYYWQSGLELTLMLLDFYAYTQDEKFAHEMLLPIATEILTFFDQQWKRDDQGKIRFDPAMALETFHQAVNPIVEIVAIHTVVKKMLALPKNLTDSEQRNGWQRLLNELPAEPRRTVDDQEILAPAAEYAVEANCENPELYPIFPYRQYGGNRPELAMARRTFAHRTNKCSYGWSQDGIQAAWLGLTDVAVTDLIYKVNHKHEASRFPAFWGPNFDWIPDQDHGGNLLMTLQSMLIQTDGDEILLFPAWPLEWNVDFKLYAPRNTVIEGSLQNGKITILIVNPPERQQDIKIKKGLNYELSI